MRLRIVILLAIMTVGHLAFTQHPLEGTWEMVSISGINADGEKFYLDTTTVKETKLITATHYILIARDKELNGWQFNRCYAGTVKMDGEKYYEFPVISSLRIFENVTTDFNWRIDGDRFIQSGTITRPDGKTIILEEFIFQRSKVKPLDVSTEVKGTWKLTGAKGDGFVIVSPTHWMSIIKDGEKLLNASGGIFGLKNKQAHFIVQYYSDKAPVSDMPVKIEGKKLKFNGYSFEK
jgi:hypothetical protein